jgi:hypothetical protein
LRFLPIFGGKMTFFSKTNVMINFSQKQTSSNLSKKRRFSQIFGQNTFKNDNMMLVPLPITLVTHLQKLSMAVHLHKRTEM